MLKVFLNLFFPRQCAVCRRQLENSDVCEDCLERIPTFAWAFCPSCNSRLQNFIPCKSCPGPKTLSGIGFAADYRRNDVRALIHAYKYRRRRALYKPLTDMLILHARRSGLDEFLKASQAAVTPIPLTRKKERQRGFNQAGLLAERFAAKLNLCYVREIITRTAERPPQVTMPDTKSRRQNVAGAFRAANPELVRGKIILLIDDVVTSGATLSEAAKALKAGGAKSVWAVTVARGH
jgi:ComF family protein